MIWPDHLGNFRPLSFNAYKEQISKYHNPTTPKWGHTTVDTGNNTGVGQWARGTTCYALHAHLTLSKRWKQWNISTQKGGNWRPSAASGPRHIRLCRRCLWWPDWDPDMITHKLPNGSFHSRTVSQSGTVETSPELNSHSLLSLLLIRIPLVSLITDLSSHSLQIIKDYLQREA